MPVDTLGEMSALATLATVASVLVLEAGLLIGIALPAGSLVLGLGVLGGTGELSLPLVALTVAATVLGAALGHHAVSRLTVARGHRTPAGALGGGGPVRRRRARARSLRAWPRPPVSRSRRCCAAPPRRPSSGPARWSPPGAVAGAALPLVRDLLTVAGIPLALAVAAWVLVRRRDRLRAVRLASSSA